MEKPTHSFEYNIKSHAEMGADSELLVQKLMPLFEGYTIYEVQEALKKVERQITTYQLVGKVEKRQSEE